MNKQKAVLFGVAAILLTLFSTHISLVNAAHVVDNYQHLKPRLLNEQIRTTHLGFIDEKLQIAVNKRKLTLYQKNKIMLKIEEMMYKGPTPLEYQSMKPSRLNEYISDWKSEMTTWAKNNGLTLAQIRNITGKGNKYLMGVEL